MSFTNYYFELGYNTAIEKVAAKKEDEGMGWGAKLGLGALGAGALGAGAYFSPEILNSLGQGGAAEWAAQNVQTPMQEAGKYLAGKAGEAGEAVADKASDAYRGASSAVKGALTSKEELIENAMNRAETMQNFMSDQAANNPIPGSIKGAFSEAGKDIANTATPAINYASGKAGDAANYIKEMAMKAGNPVR